MRFNLLRSAKSKTRNYQGEVAYKMSPELELYAAVVTASLSKLTYETVDKRLSRIRVLIRKVKPEFVAKLAVYTRTEMHLRSIPLFLITELSKVHNGDDLVSKAVEGVIQRADEITELLACYQMTNNRKDTKKLNKLSKQLQKGIAKSFNKFDEYQFAKYNRSTEVTFKDALFLAHPKAKDESQQALFDKIVGDTLDVPYTWEVELSKLGQIQFFNELEKKNAFRAKWEELIESGRLGYMALMRNLRNILEANVGQYHMEMVGERLASKKEVLRSKQLPFRFLSAYRELENLQLKYASYLMDCLEKALMVSAQNIKGFDMSTSVLLAADVSGSMFSPVSKKSKVAMYDIGLLLSMLMRSQCKNVMTGIFGDRWKVVNLPASQILSNTMQLRKIEGSVGYSTNGYLVIRDLLQRKIVMDKVMFFTDMQMWDSNNVGNHLQKDWKAYKREVAPNAKLYLFDLAGYGQTPLRLENNDVFLIAGWSDKVFDILSAIDEGSKAIQQVKKIEL